MNTTKTTSLLNLLIIISALIPTSLCQQGLQDSVSAFSNDYQDDTFMRGQFIGPAVGSVGTALGSSPVQVAAPVMAPPVRGYSNVPMSYDDNMYTAPVHAQYWTGSQGPYQQYPIGYMPKYQQPMYTQSMYGPQSGFDAQYWTGKYYPRPQQFYGAQAYTGYGKYPQPYPYGPSQYPMYPAYPAPYGRPYPKKSGSGLTKTLLGAVVVGAVAGAVARG